MEVTPKDIMQAIFTSTESKNIPFLLLELHSIIQSNLNIVNTHNTNLIDFELLEEIKYIVNYGNTRIYFGKTLWDIKCVIQDDDGLREHEIFIQYKAPKQLCLSSVKLPHSPIQDREYSSIGDIVIALKKYISDLGLYFYELELIDQHCAVMEPVNPTFKDNYRRILLDDRVWLHVEVTADGLATNIYLVGHSNQWHNKLQEGLLSWDHDKDIIKNILTVFDLSEFPHPSRNSPRIEETSTANVTECCICLCAELPDQPGVPLPLCQNVACGVYFHRNCLYQWLVACAGSRPPAFGVANGACPICQQPITCSERDS